MPDGQRCYAIGDVHARCDLFGALVTAVDRDDAAAGLAETTVALLGELLGRGPESAGEVAVARAWQRCRRVRLMAGTQAKPLSHVVVHDHTICDGGDDTGFRVGIDTGAYQTGRLTALVLGGGTRRVIPAVNRDGATKIEPSEAGLPEMLARPLVAQRAAAPRSVRAG